MTIRDSQTYDNLTLLKDAGAVTASGAAQVASAARVLDMGPANFRARAIINTSAIDFAQADETYRVSIQGCNAIGFGSGVVELGSVTVSGAGRAEASVYNQVGGVTYQYVRAFITVGGTTPSINCVIYLVPFAN